MDALAVAKGHGTENDFVLVSDPAGTVDLEPGLVAALCERRSGIGGDGLIRVVRCRDLPDGLALAGEAEWFMDYWNADGSPAEMCGNGARVFTTYLHRLGFVDLADGESLTIGTRAGVKRVRRTGDQFEVDLGAWRIAGGGSAAEDGADAAVTLAGERTPLPGLSVDVGNPHVVVAVPDRSRLALADLGTPPAVAPAPADGVNVELVVPAPGTGAQAEAEVIMRVHERGVGETRSCGTGAAAAVLATRAWGGPQSPDRWRVQVPGGTLQVSVPRTDLLSGTSVRLAGPAVLVGEGEITSGWLAARAGTVGAVGATAG
jgi:diaminopimelate epimerase